MFQPGGLSIERFAGHVASVNAWIISNATHSLLIDALCCENEANQLADQISASGKTLHGVLVTHGHADHYAGVRTLYERFENCRIMVASDVIKDDLIDFTCHIEAFGTPLLPSRVRSQCEAYPDGFDYDAIVEVLDDRELILPGGGTLLLRADHLLVAAPHMTTVHVPEANALFTSDFVSNGVHPWLGSGVPRDNIDNWMKGLADLKWRHSRGPCTIYPGHGPAGGLDLLDATRSYLCDFLAAADACRTNAQMWDRLMLLYPDHEQADFVLANSVAFHGPDAEA